jgi:uncharacterized lipoprotein YddW (UPF0748 family)
LRPQTTSEIENVNKTSKETHPNVKISIAKSQTQRVQMISNHYFTAKRPPAHSISPTATREVGLTS